MTYEKFEEEELILRDLLATDRTILANERTFLAYVRTGFAISAGGITILKVFKSLSSYILGWALIGIGIFTFISGFIRYKKVERDINLIPTEYEEIEDVLEEMEEDEDEH
jgi:putative membrane protein